MKPYDKHGNRLYPHVFEKLLKCAKTLLKLGYQESRSKPNLFFCRCPDKSITFFADMRGRKDLPIWKNPEPTLWAVLNRKGIPFWKQRRIVRRHIVLLNKHACPFSLYDSWKMCYLAFSDRELEKAGMESRFEEMTKFGYNGRYLYSNEDGYCKKCGKDFQDEGLLCPECKELREFAAQEVCELCGKPHKGLIRHHVQYEPERVLFVCQSCHLKIHRGKEFSVLKPEQGRQDWIAGRKS